MVITRKIEKDLILETVIYIAGLASIILFFRDNFIATFFVIASWLVALKFWHEKHDIYYYLTALILGPLGEITAVYIGVWTYTNPTAFGIPLWLPFAWGSFVMLAKRIAETFVEIKK